MTKINIEKLVKVIKGKVLQKNKRKTVKNISIDTRKLKKGDLFIALKGENFDGHNFVGEAIKKGASGVVISQVPLSFDSIIWKKNNYSNLLVIKVDDTLLALQEIAGYYRKMFDCLVIGITGSNGKTTTKEMIFSILKRKFSVLATEGNLNNQIGLPLTLLKLEKKHRICVLEMGASNIGEIARLAQISSPQIGLITNISNAHLESFGSLKNILSGKMELINALPAKKGVAILNIDNVKLRRILETNKIKCKWLSFGVKNRGHIYATNIKNLSYGIEFKLHIKDKQEKIRLPMLGIVNVYNALAASAVGCNLNMDISLIKQTLENFSPVPMRMEKLFFKDIEVINDAYNANPVSMKNAIGTFSGRPSAGKKILILGDMLELGKDAVKEHRKTGKIAAKACDILFTIGDLAAFTAQEARKFGMKKGNIFVFKDRKKLTFELKKIIQKKDMLLFKASRAMKLEEVVRELKNSSKKV